MLGGGLGANQSKILGAGSVSNTQALNMNTSSATFLQSELNINDPAVLRKRIADLETENKKLKESENSGGSSILGTKGSGTIRGPAG